MANQANKGRALEQIILQAIAIEESKKKAVLFKVPTPWTVIRGYNPQTRKTEIVKAFPEKSNVDFIGLYMGRPLAFEAKSTENKTSFPLGNIEPHQIAFLKDWQQGGGLSFIIIEFTTLRRAFYVSFDVYCRFTDEASRRSIPLVWLEENAYEIKQLIRFLDELKRVKLI